MSERGFVDIEIERELYDRVKHIAEDEGVTVNQLTQIFLAGYLDGVKETVERLKNQGETEVTITIPTGYLKALQGFVEMGKTENVEEYLSRLIKEDLDAQFNDTTIIGEYIQPRLKQLLETA